MAKFCGQCGTPIEAGKPFCISCGAPTGEVPAAPAPAQDPEATVFIDSNPQPAAPAPAPQPRQSYAPPVNDNSYSYNTPVYGPAPKKKTGLIIGIIAAVAVIAAVLVYFIFFSGGGKKDLIGIWVNEDEGISYEFKDNGTIEMTHLISGSVLKYNYSVKGDTITLENGGDTIDMDFKIKGKELTLKAYGNSITMTKVKSLDKYLGGSNGGSNGGFGDYDDYYDDYDDYYDDYDDYYDDYDDYYDYYEDYYGDYNGGNAVERPLYSD